MDRSVGLFVDHQGLRDQLGGLVVPLQIDQRPAQHRLGRGRLRVDVPIETPEEVKALAVVAFRLHEVPLLELHGAEVDQIVAHVGMTVAVQGL